MPRGRAWPRSPGTVMHQLLTAIAAEYDRIDAAGRALAREMVPSDALDLLEDWEEATGATQCVRGASVEARRAAVVSRLRGGPLTYDMLERLIEDMGYTPILEHWQPFMVGRSTVGDALTNDEWQHSVGIRVSTRNPEDDAALRCVIEDAVHAHILPAWDFEAEGPLLTEDGEELLTEDGEVITVE